MKGEADVCRVDAPRRHRRVFAMSAFLACLAMTTACGKGATNIPTELVGYNHTSESLDFSVGEVSGGLLMPGTGGGGFVCCVALPTTWHEGLTVTIEWHNVHQSFKRVVPVPPYDPKTVSDFNVHFLRNGEIKVFPLHYGLYHSNYPLKGEEAELIPGKPIVPLY